MPVILCMSIKSVEEFLSFSQKWMRRIWRKCDTSFWRDKKSFPASQFHTHSEQPASICPLLHYPEWMDSQLDTSNIFRHHPRWEWMSEHSMIDCLSRKTVQVKHIHTPSEERREREENEHRIVLNVECELRRNVELCWTSILVHSNRQDEETTPDDEMSQPHVSKLQFHESFFNGFREI